MQGFPDDERYEGRLRRGRFILNGASALSIVLGIYFIYSDYDSIQKSVSEIAFNPHIGAFFVFPLFGYLFPFILHRLPKQKKWRPRVDIAILFVLLFFTVVIMAVGKYGFEAHFEAAGYHRCQDHQFIRDQPRARTIFNTQAWVLDPGNCIVP